MNMFILFSWKNKGEKSRRQLSLMSMTNHAVGVGTCTQSMTIPSYLPSRKSEESRARMAVDQEIEAASSLKDLINPKSISGKDFSDYEELDLMMAAELKRCYGIVHLIYEITERGAVIRQKGEKLLHRAED